MNAPARLRVLLIDPSLFTAPYDAALTEGLVAAGVTPSWAIRPVRDGDRQEIAPEHVGLVFYGRLDGMRRAPAPLRAAAKGLAHIAGLVRLARRVEEGECDVVHFQWTVVPWLDVLAMQLLRRSCPVVLTVHDTTPFNGESATAWQSFAVDVPLRCADRLIVHTEGAREALLGRGVPSDKVALIPHGPLRLPVAPSPSLEPRDPRWTFVLFGELKHYKGVDVLVEAVARLPDDVRRAARVIIAGRPRMDLEPVLARIAALGLGDTVEVRPGRLSEQEMADLFEGTDCFVFPYRQVDASGVYFLVKSCRKWIIASDLGIFAEDMAGAAQGRRVPAEDVQALSEAMAQAVRQRPVPVAAPPSAAWSSIGRATAALYREALAARKRAATAKQRPFATRRPSLRRARVAERAFSSVAALSLVALALLALAAAPWLLRLASPIPEVAAAASPAGDAPMALAVPEAKPARAAADGPGSPGAPLGIADRAYRLVKDWDFRSRIRDEPALRAEFFTRYIYAGGTLDHLNDEWSRYRDAENHVFTPEGLALTARVRADSLAAGNAAVPGNVESGMLRSRWSGQYGVFEIRMRPPAGRGLWPAFWLNPEDGVWPPEIDVVEIVDNGRDTPRRGFHFVHGVDEKKKPAFSRLSADHYYAPGIDYTDGFHVFSAEWTPERVRHRVDGALVVEREFRWVHADGKDAGPAHVLVNLAVGGKWPGSPSAGALPAQLVVDYIRVWQR